MFRYKNSFYRKLNLHPDIKKAITYFNKIKKKMLDSMDSQGYHIRKRK